MWRDTTSYSQGQKDRIPTAFTAKSGEIRITVTSNHRDYRPVWVMHCYAVGIDTKPLTDGISAEEAQCMAVEIVQKRLKLLTRDTERIVTRGKG